MHQTERDTREIEALVARLVQATGMERARVRDELVLLGGAAVVPLVDTVRDGPPEARREALKALQLIGDKRAETTFFDALEDDDPICRWLAAEGLLALGPVVLGPALKLLVDATLSGRLERGLHHVLFEFGRNGYGNLLAPVLEAFHSGAAAIRVPLSAHRALMELHAGKKMTS